MTQERRYQLLWVGVLALSILTFLFRGQAEWLIEYPDTLVVPFVDWINIFMSWFVEVFQWFFRILSVILEQPMTWIQVTLQWLPWPATIAVFTIIAHQAAGTRLAVFTFISLLYMAVVGYWEESMNTMALVGVSVPLSIAIGFGLGVWAQKSRRVRDGVYALLDLMQTIPAFAYLIPILLLFGFGPVVGLIASAIYAAPPMVRNTILGIDRISPSVIEAAKMCGATPRQRFWRVEVPAAMPQLLVGINQTTMAALSMVIIAAIIGGFGDVGWEVLKGIRRAAIGQALLSGAVIVLLAMVLDRISWGYAERSGKIASEMSLRERYGHLALAVGIALVLIAAAQIVPALHDFPEEWVYYPAAEMDAALTYIIGNYSGVIATIKNVTLFYFLLPIKLGLEKAVSPFSWGFALTPAMSYGYAAAVLAISALLVWRKGWLAGLSSLLILGLIYFGFMGTPWPAFIAVVTLIAYQVGNARVALFAFLSFSFMLVAGLWERTMLSVYLCSAAVLFCIVVGCALGAWAAENDRVSRIFRPINDTLQTMPQFVLLITGIMLFQSGDFSALLAVISYAIVPCIRYTEQGLRGLPAETLEAATQMGLTKRQILFNVKLPLATPEIMLGINQTIVFGLAMLVIAAIAGTQGLGQGIYEALGKADMGRGVIMGLSMALIAMVADRIIQAWSHRKKVALGLAEG